MWIIIVLGILCFILILGIDKDKKTIKCNCGHVFKVGESRIIEYKSRGKLQKAQECPKCGKYTEI